MLGGVRITHERGLVAHSDGDVVLHALSDALLGAAGLGDIGQHFPDSDTQYKDIDSRQLLRHVVKLIQKNNYCVTNTDITIIAQAPKLASHLSLMAANIAADLMVDQGLVNLKATTTEELGYIGRKEGIAAHAVVLINQ